jgi:hypothetical protein
MGTWVEQLNRRAQILVDQIIAARLAAKQADVDLSWMERQHREMLERLYADEYASAHLRDTSDLIVRAEGPGADHDAPSLKSFAWLSEHVRIQLSKLGEAVLPLAVNDARAVAKKLGWVFSGYAPGSIMLGFALKAPPLVPGFEDADKVAFDVVRSAAQSIASIPQYVGDTEVSPGIADHFPDPALRDAAIVAAYQLAPTAQSGIHTVEVATPGGQFGSLSMRERVVLKLLVDSPMLRRSKNGSFVGDLRAADLDKHRLILRAVDGIGSIRCVTAPELDDRSRKLFGGRVRVFGAYETDRDNRPRLMRVERIQEVSDPVQRLPLE